MNVISKSVLGVALLALVAGCGSESPTADNQTVAANEQFPVDNSLIAEPVLANEAAPAEPSAAAPVIDEPAAVKIAPVPPKAPPKVAPKADAPKAPPKPKTPPPAADPHAGHDMNKM